MAPGLGLVVRAHDFHRKVLSLEDLEVGSTTGLHVAGFTMTTSTAELDSWS